jgi:putative nucleotidyltransferase with HDIG domain
MDSDNYTYHHSVNVAILSILTAKSMHYSESDIKTIALGALLHDIGKAQVAGGLVQKPGELSSTEKDEMKKHPEYGYQLIKNIPTLSYAVKQIVRLHHEKLDGSGYPLGLSGMEIPNYVRLITVCDMYDAMTADRIYRKKNANSHSTRDFNERLCIQN